MIMGISLEKRLFDAGFFNKYKTDGSIEMYKVRLVAKGFVVSRCIAETEYRSMAQGVCELLWLKSLMRICEVVL